ncbi:calcium:proton antiporter [Nitratireductor indicus]|uniref:Sodium/calcium exchanger membrane protein n=1 Tax=Nitratireductor indicus C115 TaxID=1231190 RepID=K2N0Y8_9HYPH|nr:ionic transporter y4hA [Nitratireductor indicus]EKF41148.1 sodium/calcium exchanger membrane protein [Nitratireductor indicus C115]MDS1138213.1 ionic transporter y4hA [Nitratireductor indicus]SFQ64190.1 Ca2+:H+ antiporter [Nitratireductor indicus]
MSKPFQLSPTWGTVAPPAIAIFLILAANFHLVGEDSMLFVLPACILLIASVFSSVHFAEIISLRVGQPYGSIVLAMAVTVIEASLIISMMMSPSEGDPTIARDTVFATVMMVLNGIIGLCLLSGGLRHREQSFQSQGAVAAFSVLGTLATLTLILPNFTLAVAGPFYSTVQLGFVTVVSLVLYGLFLFVQTVRHRRDFIDLSFECEAEEHSVPSNAQAGVAALFLVLALTMVVLLAEALAPAIERGVIGLGLAEAFVGLIIAAVVLLPEGMTAFRAASANRLQTSLNIAAGSALASVGLSIPTVAIASLFLDQSITLGLEPEHTVLLVLSFFVGTLTLATGRTTIMQGAVHLVVFACFVLLAAAP